MIDNLVRMDAPGTIRLREGERQLVLDECQALLSRPLPAPTNGLYNRLLGAAEQGVVPADLHEPLQALLEVGMQSGRIRSEYGAHAEMDATRLYSRLPRGKLYHQSIEAANETIRTLAGLELDEIAFRPRGPGSCSLTLQAGGRRIGISIARGGLTVDSVETSV